MMERPDFKGLHSPTPMDSRTRRLEIDTAGKNRPGESVVDFDLTDSGYESLSRRISGSVTTALCPDKAAD